MSAAPAPIPVPRRKRIKRVFGVAFAGIAVVAVCLVVRYYWGSGAASAQGPAAAQPAATGQSVQKLDVVAVVNGEAVRREELAQDCLRRYGKDVLEGMINKQLILDYCQRKNITVAPQEVEAEIQRTAQSFRITKEQLFEALQKERGISAEQYTDDIILPTLALRKAAKDALQVTPQEVQAAYETQFGPQVAIRMILCRTQQKAQEALAKVKADPGNFGKIAKELSEDPSAANEGIVLPIRQHMGEEKIEQAAFALKPSEISPIIAIGEANQAGRQYVILKCEEHVKDRYQEYPLQNPEIRQRIEQAVRDRRERAVSGQLFERLGKEANIIRVLGDPKLSQQYPGVAAYVGQRSVTLEALADECLRRHGVEVLEGTISRRIIQQQCRASGIQVTQQDMDAEIVRAAKAMNVLTKDKRPDVKTWLEVVEREQGLKPDLYVDDIVWPTTALKVYVNRTAPGAVQVTQEDLQKGFEASFGPKVKCKAIVLNNQRTANDVWQKCRDKGANEVFFAQMAKQFSVDLSNQLNGDISPIQMHGGRPQLEKAAFALQQGEMSGIIQVEDKFVILLCTGHTEPVKVTFEEVKQEIYDDLFEKKLRIEMAKTFEKMMDGSRIENYLANTRQAPKQPQPSQPSSARGQTVPRR
jgi:parvulin-like peptidyl-prolyl isomerase